MTVLVIHLTAISNSNCPLTTVKTLLLTAERRTSQPRLEACSRIQTRNRGALARCANRFAAQLGREDGFEIRFDDDAVDLVLARSQEAEKPCGLLRRTVQGSLVCLKQIAQRTGKTAFTLTPALVDNTDREISPGTWKF
jgi:hypothetical protein